MKPKPYQRTFQPVSVILFSLRNRQNLPFFEFVFWIYFIEKRSWTVLMCAFAKISPVPNHVKGGKWRNFVFLSWNPSKICMILSRLDMRWKACNKSKDSHSRTWLLSLATVCWYKHFTRPLSCKRRVRIGSKSQNQSYCLRSKHFRRWFAKKIFIFTSKFFFLF